MCGICGYVKFNSAPEMDLIRNMTEVLTHRGPDSSNYTLAGAAALGHARLSIIDIEGGEQPLWNEDHSIASVVNGEFYNYPVLKKWLQNKGHVFKTKSDSEAAIHLFEQCRESSVNMLDGMFAIAVWDKKKESLLLARDRIGQKPLYYSILSDGIAFASEIKSLLQMDEIKPVLDENSIADYLTLQYMPEDKTGFKGIQKLLPGCILLFDRNGQRIYRYWTPKPVIGASVKDIPRALTGSIKARLMSDVPLGAFLSGGIDSSLIVAIMSRLQGKVKTYTAAFEEKNWDESSYARQIARKFRTDHTEIPVKPDIIEALPSLIHIFDEPFGDPSAIPMWYISREASKHVKVVLSGDGGDESFSGYERYAGLKFLWLARTLPDFFIIALKKKLSEIHNRPGVLDKTIRWLGASLDKPGYDYLRLMSIFWPEHLSMILSKDFIARTGFSYYGPSSPGYTVAKEASRGRLPLLDDITSRLARADLLTYLPGDVLQKVDRTSMAHGLEIRSPFLDHHLIELAMGIPGYKRMPGMKIKYILRNMARTLLPQEILTRPKKGFGVPLKEWFRGPLKPMLYDTLDSSKLVRAGILRNDGIQNLLNEHSSGLCDHSHRLWILMMLELWSRTYSVQC